MGSPNNNKGRNIKKISVKKRRIIIDLRIKGLSLNDIVDHFQVAYRTKITIYFIKKLIKKCHARAKKLNRFYDSLVSDLLEVVEFDEVYQGMEGKIIGGVHKDSLYLIAMERFESKSIEEIKRILMPIAERISNIKIVFTDLLPAYKTVIKEVFVGALHQNCCVHALKDLKKEAEPMNSAAKKAYKKLKKLKKKLKEQKETLKKKKKKLRRLEKQQLNWKNKRKSYLKLNNIKPYSRISPSDTTRIQFNSTINDFRSRIRSLSLTISNIEDKNIKIRCDIPSLEKKYKKKLVKRLQAGRLVKKFKDLIYAHPKVFEKKYEQFMDLLKRKQSDLAKYLRKFIKNNPNLFTLKRSEFAMELSPNFWNTNSIESIFGRYRAFLDKYRTILGSEFQESIFEILRLHHNFSKPYTGVRKDTSPLQRLGIHSKYSNYLDALFGEVMA